MATNPETRAGSRGLKAAAGALFFLGTVALAGVVLQVTQSSDDELLAQAKDAEFLSFGPRGPAPHQTGQDPRTPGPDLAVDAASPGSAAGGTPEAVAVADGQSGVDADLIPGAAAVADGSVDAVGGADNPVLPASSGAGEASQGVGVDESGQPIALTESPGDTPLAAGQQVAAGVQLPVPFTVAERAASSDGRAVTWAFAGDTNFEGNLGALLRRDPSLPLEPVADLLGSADLTVLNLETAVTDSPGAATTKQFVFRAPTSAFSALAAAGVDAVTMANNHGLDFGRDGLAEALAAADRAGVKVVGIGVDETSAFAPAEFDVGGERVALFGATDVMDGPLISAWRAQPDRSGLAMAKGADLDLLAARIAQVRPSVDTVVVYLHWGIERQTCPSDRQAFVAEALVRAGADVVVGTHAHRLQGAGWRPDGAFVGYGLGNFAFASAGGDGANSGVLRLETDDRAVTAAAWLPALIRDGQPIPLADENAETAFSHWRSLLTCTDLTHDPR
ncbi:MAG: CapA family protein [Acidimicrobiia bacterium]|nr:CapA family protein [Acidimicrobiia bacterium]